MQVAIGQLIMDTVTCRECGAQFEAFKCHVVAGGSKGTLCATCRPTKADRRKRVTVQCAQCGAGVELKQSEYDNNKHKRFFCGRPCMGAWRSIHQRGEAHHNYTGKVPVKCEVCGADKEVYPSAKKAYKVFFCSDKCKGIWHHEHQSGDGAGNIDIPCAQCGMPKSVPVWSLGQYEKRFCSRECQGKWTSEHPTSERKGAEVQCDWCSNRFYVKPGDVDKEHHFCSSDCARSYAKTLRGPKSRFWRGGNIHRHCKICKKAFSVKPAVAAKTAAAFCSKACADKALIKDRTEAEKAMLRINKVFRASIWSALKGKKDFRSWRNLVGYDVTELKAHLESLFVDGMNWSNYGEWRLGGPLRWVIDHKRPRASFSFSNAEDPQFKECWGLANLQPMWGPENARKGDKLDYASDRKWSDKYVAPIPTA
jgi:hypothetical protein